MISCKHTPRVQGSYGEVRAAARSRATDGDRGGKIGRPDAYRGLYNALRDGYMPEDAHGDPDPVRVHFSPDAKTVFIDAVNTHRAEMDAAGFPARLKGPWSKLEAYMARLSLLLALARAADTGDPERVETRDVLSAVALADYLKNHARRVYVGLYGADPLDRLAVDLAAFLKKHGGWWEGQPAELHAQLQSEHKPPRVNELGKAVRAIVNRTRTLTLDELARIVRDAGPAFGDLLARSEEEHPELDHYAAQLAAKRTVILAAPDGKRLWRIMATATDADRKLPQMREDRF